MHRTLPIALAAALVVTAAVAQPEAAPQTVEVQLSNFAFTPETIRRTRGQPPVLRLINTGSGGHNFPAPAFSRTGKRDDQNLGLIETGKVELAKGETREIRFVPMTAGKFKLHCSHFMHTAFGMKGRIVVAEP